jgi:N-acetylglucosaminyl-diphospho-decaprenol L-rhamnosyltransferase
LALIDIVIVNWNSGHFLREGLTALANSSIANRLKVVVIDNFSSDSSACEIENATLATSIIHNASNCGFAVASNQGARAGNAPFILFLNPDVNVDSDSLERALKGFTGSRDSSVGVVGIRLRDEAGGTWRSCARRPTAAAMLLRTLFLDRIMPRIVAPHFLAEWDHCQTRQVDQVMGAFLMIRRDLFERLGGFDERFFLYYEDLDLCLRVRDGGYQVVYLAETAATHAGGGSTRRIKDRRFCHEASSRVLFADKYHGAFAAAALAIFISVFEIPIRSLQAILVRPTEDCWAMLRGGFLFWCGLPRLVRSLGARSADRVDGS